jgi:hypothetical protein
MGQQVFVADSTAKRLKVHTAIENTFFGEEKKTSNIYTEFYNYEGRIVKRISVNNNIHDSTIEDFPQHTEVTSSEKIIYTYDNKKRVIQSIEKLPKSDLKMIYVYDSVNHLISSKEYFRNELQGKTVCEYNSNGQKTKEIESDYDNNTTSEFESTFVYNEEGLLIKIYQKQTKLGILETNPDNRTYSYEYTFY